MLNKIIRFCLFYSGTRWCPRCIAFDRRIYCEKEQFGGFLWSTFYYAVKKDPYLSKDPVICLTKKGNSVYVYFFCPVYLSYVGIIQIRFSGRNGITFPLSRLSPAPLFIKKLFNHYYSLACRKLQENFSGGKKKGRISYVV